jgi:hypothetical protein
MKQRYMRHSRRDEAYGSDHCFEGHYTIMATLHQLAKKMTLFGQANALGWQLSPTPFALTPPQMEFIQSLGGHLLALLKAQDTLYTQNNKPDSPTAWVADYLNQGKPDSLLQIARNKRFKGHTPLVIRPDLLITDDGFALTEIDSVPGGIGFIAGLHHLYQQAGFTLTGEQRPIAIAFAQWLQQLPQPGNGVQVIVVSDEAQDYWPEWVWLVAQLPASSTVRLAKPQDLNLHRDQLVLDLPNGQTEPVSLIYRFFELFDLPNLPKWPLIQYAIQKGLVACTPPLRPHLEEKAWLALWHHPHLRPEWQQLLPAETMTALDSIIPPGWILDPRPVPPHAHITPVLTDPATGLPLQHWHTLAGWGKKAREWVIKPSGFSPLAWGSRGVTIGHDVPQADWASAIQTALSQFGQTPYLLQPFQKPKSATYQQLSEDGHTLTQRMGRTRLCPYYLVENDDVTLLGVLATTCPADKKIIHGMKDAVLAPCFSA